MKKRTKILLSILIPVTIGGILFSSYMIHNKEVEVMEPTPIVTNTTTPTNTVTPTEVPTVEPTVVLTQIPTNTPTPTVTNTPIPTATPTPVVVDSELVLRIQTGDTVWYEYYTDGTLLVTGTGATWDFYGESGLDLIGLHNELIGEDATIELIASVKKIIIAEGITRIGNSAVAGDYATQVIIPTTLKEVGESGFSYIGSSVGSTEWIGLDLAKIKAHEKAFYRAKGLENMDTTHLIVIPTATPTPLPPTPTPLPNPEQPRLCHSIKMGDDVTYDFWDNGYAYINGSGKTYDKDWTFNWERTMGVSIEFQNTIKYAIIEDGITYIGKDIGLVAEEVFLPPTITSVGSQGLYARKVLHCYKDGKPVTVTSTKTHEVSTLFRALSDPDYAKHWEVTITEE